MTQSCEEIKIPTACPAHNIELKLVVIETQLNMLVEKVEDIKSYTRNTKITYTFMGAIVTALISGLIFLLTQSK